MDIKTQIARRLEVLQTYLGYLQSYRERSLDELMSSPTYRGAVERYFHLAIEATLDVAAMLVSEAGARCPETYRMSIERLVDLGILPKEFARRFASVAGLRNILVHEYTELDWHRLYASLQDELGDFETFIGCVYRYLNPPQ